MLRVYADTSVVGGCFDEEFSEYSQRLFEEVRNGRFTLLFSRVVLEELSDAPEAVQEMMRGLPPENVEEVALTEEVLDLRDAYLVAGILGPRWADDLTHVAAATVARADSIVSWNFKHIVRLDKIKAYNQVNLAEGYGIVTILSPVEVVIDDEE